ncbi:transcription factor bHLH94-like [Ipomoea triloba]|uniref:transcription factor bHLH94-like n=1 Tax=Ipomoea triloba TaxID=35885 RepID=UPI00125CFDB9|nr:transcription factor bHLH94-like [Ipomoea triloba]
MDLQNVTFLQDPFGFDFKDCYAMAMGGLLDCYGGFEEDKLSCEALSSVEQTASNGCWDYSPPEVLPAEYSPAVAPAETAAALGRPRKRRRTAKRSKNKEDIENQRMTHIAVERNRRRQVNDYLAVLRSFLPPSYAQRGDQASIVGGTINFVKELEQLLQFLEVHKQLKNNQISSSNYPNNNSHYPFSTFFTFPQYSTPKTHSPTAAAASTAPQKLSTVADVEVAMVESHASVKVLSTKQPKQLVKMVKWFHAMSLTVLHLNVTTIHPMVLYSFSLKVEDNCQLMSVNEIATAVHEMVAMIQEDMMREDTI